MIEIIDTMRTQTAVYWPPSTDAAGRVVPDGYGRETFGPPVELAPDGPTGGVFWKRDIEVVGGQANNKSVVFTGQDLNRGGFLYEGPLSAIPASLRNNPKEVPGAARVLAFKKVPTVEGDQFVRKAYL